MPRETTHEEDFEATKVRLLAALPISEAKKTALSEKIAAKFAELFPNEVTPQ